MEVYGGIDLHGNNSVLVLIDSVGKILYRKRLVNEWPRIEGALEPFRDRVKGVVVESTFNWYWLVDALQAARYRVHLAHPTAIAPYSGLKHGDDDSDARWLAEMLRLGIVPEGYIYPKERRGVRDLLRKRSQSVVRPAASSTRAAARSAYHTVVLADEYAYGSLLVSASIFEAAETHFFAIRSTIGKRIGWRNLRPGRWQERTDGNR